MDTRPKHKRVLRDGQTARGPARWLRAADNAMRKPMSPAGQLFWGRTKIAQEFVLLFDTDGSWEHLQRTFIHDGWDPQHHNWQNPRYEMKRQYVTCSRFCLAMVAQLDFFHENVPLNAATLFGVLMNGTDYQKVRHLPDGPKRKSRCQFCGTDVHPA